jgi:hypothetical protein
MAIDLRQWISVLSACTLGWICGFIIYSTILYTVVMHQKQPNVPAIFPQQQSMPFDALRSQASLQHAVVRIVIPVERQPLSAKSGRSFPLGNGFTTQPVSRIYL